MKSLFNSIGFLLLLPLLGACTDFSKEPVFAERQLHFTADGGEKTIGVERWDGARYGGESWDIYQFWEVIGETEELVKPKTAILPNKSVKYYGTWYSVTPSPDFRSAKVEVEPNTTGSPRVVYVEGGLKVTMDLKIKQD